MQKLRFHKAFIYLFTILFLQFLLGSLLYNAFNSPEGNTFNWTALASFWILLLTIITALIPLVAMRKLSYWILPCSVILGYLLLLILMINTDFISKIPRVKSTSVNYELVPLYFTFPGIFHAILDIILSYFKPDGKFSSNLKNFFYALSIPAGLYVFTMVIIPMCNSRHFLTFGFASFASQIALCIALTAFFFFFLRMIIGNIIGKNIDGNHKFMVLLFGILFPILGILLNRAFELFGDFDTVYIYITIVINGIGLFLLLHNRVSIKFAGLLCTSFGLPYVLYFFIIFLPYIPLAFAALIVFGAGVLMLTPTVLLLIQYQITKNNISTILKKYGTKKVVFLALTCFFILPIAFGWFCHHHKMYLQKAVAEVDYFDAGNHTYTDFDVEKLAYVLKQMEKDRYRLSFTSFEDRLPLLSMYYDWYVFDNLQLSAQKTAALHQLFLNDHTLYFPSYIPPEKVAATVTYTHETEYITEDNFYKTQIHFAITNLEAKNLREFRTAFSLPKDVFISDYYLDIEDERVYGVLAEKRAANWIYEQITNQRRDPGILQYVYDDVLLLKIYPFSKNETRTTGFTIYHKNPVAFTMNDTNIEIDVPKLTPQVTEITKDAYYIPAALKTTFPKVTAPIQYYFLVDNTTQGATAREDFQKDFERLPKSMQQHSKVLYVDADVNWQQPTAPKKSGFNLQKAVAQIKYKHQDLREIPFVVVYASDDNRYYGDDTSWELKNKFPYDNFIEYSAWNKQPFPALEFVEFSRNGQAQFLPNNGLPSLVNFNKTDDFSLQPTSNTYINALQLRLFHEENDLNPKRKRTHWLEGLRASFSQQVLAHSTTYISLENKAQEERLRKKQEEIMSPEYHEEAGTEVRRMSEPYFWLLLIFFGIYLIKQHLKKQHA